MFISHWKQPLKPANQTCCVCLRSRASNARRFQQLLVLSSSACMCEKGIVWERLYSHSTYSLFFSSFSFVCSMKWRSMTSSGEQHDPHQAVSSADIASDGEWAPPQLISLKKTIVHSSYHSFQLIFILQPQWPVNGPEVIVVAVCSLRILTVLRLAWPHPP